MIIQNTSPTDKPTLSWAQGFKPIVVSERVARLFRSEAAACAGLEDDEHDAAWAGLGDIVQGQVIAEETTDEVDEADRVWLEWANAIEMLEAEAVLQDRASWLDEPGFEVDPTDYDDDETDEHGWPRGVSEQEASEFGIVARDGGCWL